MIGSGTGAGTGACSSCSGVLNLTRGLKWDPPRVRTMAVVRKGHRGRAQLTKEDQGTDDCGSGTGNRVTARYREAAAQARAHGRQWLWQCRARLRSGCAGSWEWTGAEL